MTDRQPPAIVYGSGIVTLGVVNDLSADGVDVIHVSPKTSDIAARSRWPVERVRMRSSGDQTTEFLKLLNDRRTDWAGACILPTIDPTIRIVSKNISRIAEYYRPTIQPWRTLGRLVDKASLYAAADVAGVPTPAFLPPDALGDAQHWSDEAGLPVLVKPVQTPEFFSVFGVKALECHDSESLTRTLIKVQRHRLSVMLSEIIPGPPTSLISYRCFRTADGRIAAEMCTQKTRTHPPDYGIGLVHRTIPVADTVRRQSSSLLAELGFEGFANIEYKLDERDQRYKLMEINPRPVNCQQLFRKAGINFAEMSYRYATNQPLASEYAYRPDVYGIHNSADLYYIRSHLRRGVTGIREFLQPYMQRHKAYFLPLFRDPMPYFYQMSRIVFGKVRRLSSSFLRRSYRTKPVA